MNSRAYLLNSPIDRLTMNETLEIVHKAIKEKKQIHHGVVNAAKIVNMQKDKDLAEAVTSCDIINADGQSVVWALNLLGDPVPERVTGIDLMQNLVNMASQRKYKIFFFGATEEIVTKVVEKYSKEFPDIVAGYRNGYFKEEEEEKIAHEIAASNANILFVAISSPIKEKFLYKYSGILRNVNFIMGVGGSFDVVSGKVRRAPVWMQKSGLEWFYRLAQEPGRMWKRVVVTNTLFVLYIMKELLLKRNKKMSRLTSPSVRIENEIPRPLVKQK